MDKEELEISDDEFELPPRRKRIGWNFQSFNPIETDKPKVEKFPPHHLQVTPDDAHKSLLHEQKVNGRDVSDDIEVVEIISNSTIQRKPILPISSTRREIRDTLKSVTQSKISNFFNKSSQPSPNSKEISKPPKKDETNEDEERIKRISPIEVDDKCLEKDTEHSDSNSRESNSKEPKNEESKERKKENLEKEDTNFSESSPSLIAKFIDKWKSLKKFTTEDKRISDKVMKSYHLSHTSYTYSRKFCTGITRAIETLDSSNIYVVIKEIVDNLKQYKDVPYIEKHKRIVKEDDAVPEEEVEEDNEETKKLKRKLTRIEKEMIKLSKKIKECDEADVDLDDEDNSSYLLQERLKAQFMKLDDYYCKLSGCSQSTGRPIEKKFKYEGSRYSEINKRISAWVNKHREFPDYKDILDMVRKVTADRLLPMRPETVRVQAQEIFRDVGQILKKRREKDDMFSIYAYAGDEQITDPAENDDDLYSKLKGNEKQSKDKLDKVFQHYVDRQLAVLEDERKAKKDNGKDKDKDDVIDEEGEPMELKKSSDKENESSKVVNGDENDESVMENVEKLNDAKDEDDNDGSEINEISDGESDNEITDVEDGDDDSDIDEEVVIEPKETPTKAQTEVVDFSDDEFDDDVKDILKSADCVTIDDDVIEEEEDEEDYYTDEDVDLADSAPIPALADVELEDSVPVHHISTLKNSIGSMGQTYFRAKRKSEPLPLSEDSKRLCTSSPEIVELD